MSPNLLLLSLFRVVSHSGPQTYMLLYFRSKADSCSWGHPTYAMRALPYVDLPISRRCAPPHHHGCCVSESLSTARARRTRPLDVSLRVVRFPAPRTLKFYMKVIRRHYKSIVNILIVVQYYTN